MKFSASGRRFRTPVVFQLVGLTVRPMRAYYESSDRVGYVECGSFTESQRGVILKQDRDVVGYVPYERLIRIEPDSEE